MSAACAGCGHALAGGRFCYNCGRPVGEAAVGAPTNSSDPSLPVVRVPSTDTNVRLPRVEAPLATSPQPALAPTEAAPAGPVSEAPPVAWNPGDHGGGPRFPLYADEVAATAAATGGFDPPPVRRRSPRALPALVVLLAVLLVGAVVGGSIMVSRDTDPDRSGDTASPGGSGAAPPSAPATDAGAPDAQDVPPDVEVPDPRDITDLATASASSTAPPGTSLDGSRVEYDAANLVDGDTSTTWRVVGDGTGETLTFTFGEEVAVTSVGLVNGYAKVDRDTDGSEVDWYTRNRTVTQVRWTFDDGRVLEQDLDDDRAMQSVIIPAARTTTLTMEIVAVSGHGGADRTPVSEVEIDGATIADLG